MQDTWYMEALQYLSFWQTNKLNEFSAPRNVSSSSISTAVIQLGL
jgi:hypothetical protein